jgi:hypothetical protein
LDRWSAYHSAHHLWIGSTQLVDRQTSEAGPCSQTLRSAKGHSRRFGNRSTTSVLRNKSTRSEPVTRHSPRNGLRLIRALPGDRAFLPPSPPRSLLPENLTPASGRQDHTISPSASSNRPSSALPASTASRSAFRDVAQRPSQGSGRLLI